MSPVVWQDRALLSNVGQWVMYVLPNELDQLWQDVSASFGDVRF